MILAQAAGKQWHFHYQLSRVYHSGYLDLSVCEPQQLFHINLHHFQNNCSAFPRSQTTMAQGICLE
jgi:hypothetical protein